MKIQGGNIYLTAKDSATPSKSTNIIIDTREDPDNHIFEVSAGELKVAIEALEKTCWRA